jgi:hypothetical protein
MGMQVIIRYINIKSIANAASLNIGTTLNLVNNTGRQEQVQPGVPGQPPPQFPFPNPSLPPPDPGPGR